MQITKNCKIEIGFWCGYLTLSIMIKHLDIDVIFLRWRLKAWKKMSSLNWKSWYSNPIFSIYHYSDGRKGFMFLWFNIVYQLTDSQRLWKYYSSKHKLQLLKFVYKREEYGN